VPWQHLRYKIACAFLSAFDKSGLHFEVPKLVFFFGVVKCGVCKGILRKTVRKVWCFCGEVVVDCVAKAGEFPVVFLW
jgi:hypothetical protein